MNLKSASDLANRLLKENGLDDWSFKFSNAKKAFGTCDHKAKTIVLSPYLTALNPEEYILDTILHEIAHALVGFRKAHGYEWRACCMRIGCKPEACYDYSVKTLTNL